MTEFQVEFQDDQGLQFDDQVEANSHRKAASLAVQREDVIGASERSEFQVRVYPMGDPENDEIFSYSELD